MWLRGPGERKARRLARDAQGGSVGRRGQERSLPPGQRGQVFAVERAPDPALLELREDAGARRRAMARRAARDRRGTTGAPPRAQRGREAGRAGPSRRSRPRPRSRGRWSRRRGAPSRRPRAGRPGTPRASSAAPGRPSRGTTAACPSPRPAQRTRGSASSAAATSRGIGSFGSRGPTSTRWRSGNSARSTRQASKSSTTPFSRTIRPTNPRTRAPGGSPSAARAARRSSSPATGVNRAASTPLIEPAEQDLHLAPRHDAVLHRHRRDRVAHAHDARRERRGDPLGREEHSPQGSPRREVPQPVQVVDAHRHPGEPGRDHPEQPCLGSMGVDDVGTDAREEAAKPRDRDGVARWRDRPFHRDRVNLHALVGRKLVEERTGRRDRVNLEAAFPQEPGLAGEEQERLRDRRHVEEPHASFERGDTRSAFAELAAPRPRNGARGLFPWSCARRRDGDDPWCATWRAWTPRRPTRASCASAGSCGTTRESRTRA